MPTYEYECTDCGVTFELFQPITEKARKRLLKNDTKPCDCNAAVKRLISGGGGIIFKGSGFYQTDYRSDSYKKAAEADGKASKGSTESSESSESSDSSKSEKSGDTSTSKDSNKTKVASKSSDNAKSASKKKSSDS